MKIISLNTWGGRAGKEQLLTFFEKHADADIFCLQEVWSAPYPEYEGKPAAGKNIENETVMMYELQDIAKLLQDHTPYFRPHFLDNYGLLMLVRSDLTVIEEGDVFVYLHRGYVPDGDLGNHARNIQYMTIQNADGDHTTVINFHGLWNGKGKGDSEERIAQSKNVLSFIERLQNKFVLCGDFNLSPETKSLKLFESAGMRNLIKEYGVTSTRTSFYTKSEKFADYMLISEGIQVVDFHVLPDEVSDHAPLYLEIA